MRLIASLVTLCLGTIFASGVEGSVLNQKRNALKKSLWGVHNSILLQKRTEASPVTCNGQQVQAKNTVQEYNPCNDSTYSNCDCSAMKTCGENFCYPFQECATCTTKSGKVSNHCSEKGDPEMDFCNSALTFLGQCTCDDAPSTTSEQTVDPSTFNALLPNSEEEGKPGEPSTIKTSESYAEPITKQLKEPLTEIDEDVEAEASVNPQNIEGY